MTLHWIDFDSSIKNDQLQDDKNYLIRYKDAEGIYSRPHIAWWDAEDSMFRLLDAAAHFKLHVDQYFEIPE